MTEQDFLAELTEDFIEQVSYSLEECEEAFLNLEESSDKGKELVQIFRLAHSIKGGAAVIGLHELAHFAHTVEDLLSILRAFPEAVDSQIISWLLESVDKFKEYVEYIKSGEKDFKWDVSDLSGLLLGATELLEQHYNIPVDQREESPSPEEENFLEPKVDDSRCRAFRRGAGRDSPCPRGDNRDFG